MPGAHATFTVEEQEVLAGLQRLMDAARDTGGLMARLGEYVQRATQERFSTQTGPEGDGWAKLQERYRRRKKYNDDKILTLRGYLRSGIFYQVLDGYTVSIGSSLKYAAIHQFGGTFQKLPRTASVRYRSVAGRVLFAGKKHKRGVVQKQVAIGAHQVTLPARPFLGINTQDRQRITGIVQDWLRAAG